jgi:uncharacterized protein YkwD
MKRNRLTLKLTFFAVFALLSVSAAAQTNNQSKEKPKAILIADWSEPDRDSQGKVVRKNTATRTRIVNNNVAKNVAPTISASSRLPILKATGLEEEAFRFINEQRREQGLEPLEWDAEMLYLARQHSESMANFNFFSHTGRDGKTVDERADAAGVRDWRSIGENIAYNSGVKNKVEFAVQSWLQSPNHKNNLLSRKWTRTGIGVAQTPDGKFYITQVFRN